MPEVILNSSEETLHNLLRNSPTTRYQGSKRKMLPLLYNNFKELKFTTVLDGFGGTASVSYLFKLMGKQVTFNDILQSNYQIGIAIIENDSVVLNSEDLSFILNNNEFEYPTTIQDNFTGIYYLADENKWLDMVIYNLEHLKDKYSGELLKKKKAVAYYCLFQACLCKRPFNLFHRKNLSIRTSNVTRSFGNKTTWEKKFDTLFLQFNNEISNKIFSNGLINKSSAKDVRDMDSNDFDLVYFDPPYTRANEKKPKDYFSLYHFLEGISHYRVWPKKIDWATQNRCLINNRIDWGSGSVLNNFDALFKKFNDSTIAVSYGDPGNPTITNLEELLYQYKRKVKVVKIPYKYKLNRSRGAQLNECLLIGI